MKNVNYYPTTGECDFFINDKKVNYMFYLKSNETDESDINCFSEMIIKKMSDGYKKVKKEKYSCNFHASRYAGDFCFNLIQKIKQGLINEAIAFIEKSNYKKEFKINFIDCNAKNMNKNNILWACVEDYFN